RELHRASLLLRSLRHRSGLLSGHMRQRLFHATGIVVFAAEVKTIRRMAGVDPPPIAARRIKIEIEGTMASIHPTSIPSLVVIVKAKGAVAGVDAAPITSAYGRILVFRVGYPLWHCGRHNRLRAHVHLAFRVHDHPPG